MATKIGNLKVPAGKYTNRDGETKNRWMDCGALMESEGRKFLILNPAVNFAALMEPGKDSVIVSIFTDDNGQRTNYREEQIRPNEYPAPRNGPDW